SRASALPLKRLPAVASSLAQPSDVGHLSLMPLNIRTYHDLTEPDRSGLPGQIGAQRRRVAERLATVARVVAVMSGKGGVGKSFVTTGVAVALARAGRAVGVLDADLNGPTAPQLLGLPVASCTLRDGAIEP